MTTTRDLIQRLADALDHLNCEYNVPDQSALIAEARAYLSQPEPEEPTDEALASFTAYFCRKYPGPNTLIHNPE